MADQALPPPTFNAIKMLIDRVSDPEILMVLEGEINALQIKSADKPLTNKQIERLWACRDLVQIIRFFGENDYHKP